MSASTSLPFLGAIEQEPQEMPYSPVCREILDYQSVFFLTCVFSGVSLCPGTSLPLFYCSSFPTMEDVSVSLTQLSGFAASANIY